MSDSDQRFFQLVQDVAAIRKLLEHIHEELRVANGLNRKAPKEDK